MLRNAWLALGWVWVVAVFYVSLTPHPPEPVSFSGADKFEHALAYALLMLWFCQCYSEIRIRIFLAFVTMGVGIEILQGMTGYRFFEYADMLANASGALIGWGLALTGLGSVLLKLENHGKN